ncbi:hypothetical protein [Nonomuraea gerenzanensis]|uniref:Uncharacterized protein n=1 Tax=Nonomuraea gerenzanensis TaxID=93944 RepID=A0A1M4ED98_9ACTN|nr:hypothetical protein [Nonomuraea gerenzanensis]UBU08355.1 hypothetical protein LCN96_28580 [Nonomuraea gerenzanensis]SBO96696.1 hypothetical protein BN4615_P6212 [Nonomuraea gerenzanensis]
MQQRKSRWRTALAALGLVVIGPIVLVAPPPAMGQSLRTATGADSWHRDPLPYFIHQGYVNGVLRNVARIGEGELYWTDYGARVTVRFPLKDFATDGYCAAAYVDEYHYEPIKTHPPQLECNGVDKWFEVSMPSTSLRVCYITVRVGRQKTNGTLAPEQASVVGGWGNRDGC